MTFWGHAICVPNDVYKKKPFLFLLKYFFWNALVKVAYKSNIKHKNYCYIQ